MFASNPLADRTETVRGLAGAVLGTVRLAHSLVASQRRVDLAGLDREVGLLCAQALDLPPGQAVPVLPELGQLLDAVEALHAALIAAAP